MSVRLHHFVILLLKAKKFFVIKRFHSYIMQMIMAFFNCFYLAALSSPFSAFRG
ncbi:hypothetical protein BRO54_3423 [Geobacillus proteiniphilus]|uniref:Uncharacterized protein n=1 Tax=Geobacillus proteiniphilus TaxID=860353 RepID=A0A1Q5SM96_9BACL|nr:hypothetical protein BRO54_3423 [Geobacillus proteiniphilus]